jgi:hypothetical protein
MDVLILAAGLSSRLSKFTHDIIPKYLINLDTHTGLYYIINYWKKYSNNIFLVIHSKYNLITKFYINNILSDYKDKIIIINYDESNGTAFTLSYILNNELINYKIDNLLITWCDIYPKQNINFDKLRNGKKKDNNIYIFTNGNKCRYKLDDNNKIIHVPESNGNIIGIYYFQNYKTFLLDDSSKNNDIVIYLEKIGNIYNQIINEIIDFGDEEKYLNIINNNNCGNNIKCRYFNSIEIIDDKILKKGIDDKGKNIIKYEKEWYKYLSTLNSNLNLKIYNYLPIVYKIYEYGYLMEYKKNYLPLYKFFLNYEYTITSLNNIDKSNKEKEYSIVKISILKNIFNILENLHNIEIKKQNKVKFFSDIKKEIYDKVYDRKKIIDDVLKYFGNIEYVNGQKIYDFDVIIEKCKNIIINYYAAIEKYEYNIIFGDCNFSNILINPNDISDIVFIDPRGYFGETSIYGLSDYDYGKILYGISGYDKFNSEYFNIDNIDIEKKSININIPGISFDKNIIDKYFNKVHKAFMVINWLSLAEYNKNNIWKCFASYYYGLYLGTLL